MNSAHAPHIFLVAGEESGDRLGAALIAALKRATQGRARFSGVGGTHMAAEGVASLFPLERPLDHGLCRRSRPSLPTILRRIREAADAVIAAKPDVLVIIDSPDFTHRVARRGARPRRRHPDRRLRVPNASGPGGRDARAPCAPTSTTCWRLLPFEPEAMKRLHGPPCTFVGHPLGEQVACAAPECRGGAPPHDRSAVAARPAGQPHRRDTPHGGRCSARRWRWWPKRTGPLDVVVPAVPRLADRVQAAIANWPVPARIVTDAAEKQAAFRSARAALTKSGTSTLELALAGVPMAAAYKVPLIEELVGRLLITAPSAILANLILGENVVPEFLQRDCTPEKLAAALLPLLADTPQRRRQVGGLRPARRTHGDRPGRTERPGGRRGSRLRRPP